MTKIIAAGPGILIQALYIARNCSNVNIIYVQVDNGKNKEDLDFEKILVKRLLSKICNISSVKFEKIKIFEGFDKNYRKTYKYDYSDCNQIKDDPQPILVSSSLIKFVEKKYEGKGPIICLAEGGSCIVAAREIISKLETLLFFIRVILRNILIFFGVKKFQIAEYFLPPSINNLVPTYFAQKKLVLGSINEFSCIDFEDYKNWGGDLIKRANLKISKTKLSSKDFVHLTNKRIPFSQYREWLLSGGVNEKNLIIKAHPSDRRDFSKLFPNSFVIDNPLQRLLPSELLGLEDKNYLGWYTTALLGFSKDKIKILEVRDSNYNKYSQHRFRRLREILELATD